MTREDIDRIATEYLNYTESEFEMQDVIELADKALVLEKAIEDIKAEIDLLSDSRCDGNTVTIYSWEGMKRRVFEIIDKHIGDTET